MRASSSADRDAAGRSPGGGRRQVPGGSEPGRTAAAQEHGGRGLARGPPASRPGLLLRREQTAATGGRALAGRTLEPLGVRLEPIEVFLSLVEPLAGNERFDEIWDEPRQPRLAHVVLSRERASRVSTTAASAYRPSESSSKPRAAVANCSAGRPWCCRQRLAPAQRPSASHPRSSVSVRQRSEGGCIGGQRLLADLLCPERAVVGVCRGLGEAATKALGLCKQAWI